MVTEKMTKLMFTQHDLLRQNKLIDNLKEVTSVLASHLLNHGLLAKLALEGVIDQQQKNKIKNIEKENQVKELLEIMDGVHDEVYFCFLKVLTNCADNLLGSQQTKANKSSIGRMFGRTGEAHGKESKEDKAILASTYRQRPKSMPC